MSPWRLLRRWSLVLILERYDFSAFRIIVDVGGEQDSFLPRSSLHIPSFVESFLTFHMWSRALAR